MRCEDLTRELASPTGKLSPAEMAGHLADCPSCADWSRRVAHLDQIWEATRPAEPSEATLDALWASASLALDAQPVPSTLQLDGLTHRRRTWTKVAFFTSQAAALLIAALFLFKQGGHDAPQVAVATPEKVTVEPVKPVGELVKVVPPLEVVAETDEPVVVEIGSLPKDHRKRVLKELASDSSSIPVGNQRDLFNELESAASL